MNREIGRKHDTNNRPGASRVKTIVAVLLAAGICTLIGFNFSCSSKNSTGSSADGLKTEAVAIVPFSGKGTSHGEYFREGAQMYAKDHPDSRIQLTIIDSASDPQKAISGFQQQIALRKPQAAISLLSAVSDTLAPIAETNKILLIGINTATDTFVDKYTHTQRITDRPVGHTAPIAALAAKKFNKVGLIYANDAFGLICKTTFEKTYHQSNNNELILESYNATDRDQNIVVQRLLAKQPDAVFVAGYGPPYISIFQALRTFKFAGPVFADINFSNPEVLTALGEAADGVVFAAMDFNVSPPSTPEGAAFLEKYRKTFNKEPWLGSAFAYDALAILEHLANAKQPLDRQSVFALKQWPGIAAQLSFPSPGECQYVFQFVRRSAGKNLRVDLDK